MTIHHTREYEYVIQDMAAALSAIKGIHTFIGLEYGDYVTLNRLKRIELLKKTAGEILLDLQYNNVLYAGRRGRITYLKDRGKIRIDTGEGCTFLINLIEH